jgi:biopolymer transport protein ExbB
MEAFINGQLHSIGGPILLILLVVSVVATAAAIVEIALLWRLGAGRHRAAEKALALWRRGDAEGALRIVASDPAALS